MRDSLFPGTPLPQPPDSHPKFLAPQPSLVKGYSRKVKGVDSGEGGQTQNLRGEERDKTSQTGTVLGAAGSSTPPWPPHSV